MSISDWAGRSIRPIVFATAILCLGGIGVYRSFPVSILPDITFPRVVVIAEAGDKPSKLVEASMTRPIEEAAAEIPNVKRIRSKTKRGSTEVSIDFMDGTDIIVAEQLVNAKVNQVRPELPPETRTEVERMNPTVFPVFGLTVTSKSLTPTELWNLATYTLRPRLARVDGVARVVVQGGLAPEFEVAIKPNEIAAAGLSHADVVEAIRASNVIRAVGRLDKAFQRYQVVVTGELKTPDDIRNIVVAEKDGLPVRLRQIADVRPSTEDRTTVVSANGAESVLINIIRQPNANSVAMVDAVNTELKRIRPTLPQDVVIGTFYDQSILIREAISSVIEAVAIGALLAVVVLLIFLRDIRATLITASIIPLTLFITFLLMRLAGLTLNLMTLGALAVGIGLIVDDAIVVVECVFRNLKSEGSTSGAVRAAASQITAPMVSSTLTTVVVFLPLAFLTGVAGAFFSALALTLAMALMVSLVLALCLSPSLCAAFLKYRENAHEESGTGKLQNGYNRLLAKLLAKKKTVIPIILITLFGTWFISTRLETGFMPAIDEGAFVLDYLTPPGTSLDESDRLLRKVDEILKQTPEIWTFSRRTGTELGFAITESNSGDYAIMLRSDRHRSIEDVIADVRGHIESEIPGLEVEFIQVLQDLIGDLAGNPNPIEVKLFGENKVEVEAVAEQMAEELGKTKGLVDVTSGVVESGPEVEFQLDSAEVGRRGLTVEQVADQVNSSLLGTVASEVLQGDRQVPIRVRLPKDYQGDLEKIERVGISTPSGRVLLKDLGTVSLIRGTTQSTREDQRRVVLVSAGLEGIDLGTAVSEVNRAIRETKLPPGVTAVLAGQFQSQQESFRNLTLVLAASVILVFTVMLFQFNAFIPPAVILILMPLSLFGAVVGLWATRTALNVSSFMGVIMLAGIVVKNGILLLDHAQTAVKSGATPDAAVLEAGKVRLRPILMTTLTAVLGLVPLALGIGAGAEMQKPLAVSVIGGLVFSTILTLLIGPVVYAWLASRGKPAVPTE